jgi:hypothetical protein
LLTVSLSLRNYANWGVQVCNLTASWRKHRVVRRRFQRLFGVKEVSLEPLVKIVPISQAFAGAGDDDGWSNPLSGLQARLSFARGQALNGIPLIAAYLELRNVANVANGLEVPLNLEAIQFEVVDEQDISLAHASLPKDQAALFDLGVLDVWV